MIGDKDFVPKKIVIVGAGIVGLTAAYMLIRKGHKVTLFESRDGVAAGCSFANAALLTPSMSHPMNAPSCLQQLARSFLPGETPLSIKPMAALRHLKWGASFLRNSNTRHFRYATEKNFILSNYSLRETAKLKEQLGIQFDNSTTGSLKIFRSKFEFRAARDEIDKFEHDDLPIKYLGAEETCALEPTLSPVHESIAGSAYHARDEAGDPVMFAKELAKAFLSMGGQIRLDTKVFRINTENGVATSIEASTGTILADKILVTTGHCINDLLSGIGEELLVAPLKGYTLTVTGSSERLPQIPIVDAGANIVLTPLGNRLRVSGFAELSGDPIQIPTNRLQALTQGLRRLFPVIADKMEEKNLVPWAGLRPVSVDGLPYIGEIGIRNVFVGAGHGHLGWTMAVGTANLLASQILDEPEPIDASPYLPSRLKAGFPA